MRVDWLAWAMCAGAAFASPAFAAPGDEVAADVRTLRAADTELQVVVAAGTRARADALHAWVAEAAGALRDATGRFPLRRAEVRVQEIASRDPSPVPWGQTSRRGPVAVLLYVRRDAGIAELRRDWTAAHELAHLFHPYLGDRGRWLAEGLASYYQHLLRARAGLLAEDEAWRDLEAGFARGRRAATGVPLGSLGHRRGGRMRVYWAGAAYWLESDLALRAHGTDLDAVLGAYARCCLRGTASVSPAAFVAALDGIDARGDFVARYRRYAASTVFPPLDEAYARLGLARERDGLRPGDATEAARLRRAIMGRRAGDRATDARGE